MGELPVPPMPGSSPGISLCLLPFGRPGQPWRHRQPHPCIFQLSGSPYDLGAQVGTSKAARLQRKGFGGEPPPFPTHFPPPRQPETPSPGSHPPPSIGAELSGCCGSLPPCPGPALGARTSLGSLERLCLLRCRSEGCTTCGGEAHPSPRIKITPFFPNWQRVLQCPPAWHSRARPSPAGHGRRDSRKGSSASFSRLKIAAALPK